MEIFHIVLTHTLFAKNAGSTPATGLTSSMVWRRCPVEAGDIPQANNTGFAVAAGGFVQRVESRDDCDRSNTRDGGSDPRAHSADEKVVFRRFAVLVGFERR